MQEHKMKTKSNLQSHGSYSTYSHALVTLLCRIRYITGVALILVAALLACYSAIANAGRDGIQSAVGEGSVSPVDTDQDSEEVEKRNEFLERFFATGRGGVSPSAYANAVAAARALPRSPLLQGRRFAS